MADYDFTDKKQVREYLIDAFSKNDYEKAVVETARGPVTVYPFFEPGDRRNIDNVSWYSVDSDFMCFDVYDNMLDLVCESIAEMLDPNSLIEKYHRSEPAEPTQMEIQTVEIDYPTLRS